MIHQILSNKIRRLRDGYVRNEWITWPGLGGAIGAGVCSDVGGAWRAQRLRPRQRAVADCFSMGSRAHGEAVTAYGSAAYGPQAGLILVVACCCLCPSLRTVRHERIKPGHILDRALPLQNNLNARLTTMCSILQSDSFRNECSSLILFAPSTRRGRRKAVSAQRPELGPLAGRKPLSHQPP
jgi:hypothetical protein